MNRIIGAAAVLTIALATYAASVNPYDARSAQGGASHQSAASQTDPRAGHVR